MRYFLIAILSFFFLIAYSCRTKSEDTNISPGSISFGGIKFSQSKSELYRLIPNLHCPGSQTNSDTCFSILPKSGKNGVFRSVHKIVFEFEGTRLKMFRSEYDQMFDVEYQLLRKEIMSQYSNSIDDTLSYAWQYDSLRIKLTPNERLHWTRRFMIYSPVVEFQKTL